MSSSSSSVGIDGKFDGSDGGSCDCDCGGGGGGGGGSNGSGADSSSCSDDGAGAVVGPVVGSAFDSADNDGAGADNNAK